MEISKIKLDGAQRACAPIDTIRRMRPWWSQAGITRVGEITGLDRIGIPVAQCVRPDAFVLSVDSGKGATSEAAICSAMMEGFERHVGESAKFDTINAAAENLTQVESRFPLLKGAFYNPKIERAWTSAVGIFSKQIKIVPEASAMMRPNQSVTPIFSACFVSDSNGLSSGNTLEEAIIGGLYEVIERDQVACNSAKGRLGMRVNLDSIQDQTLGNLVELLRSNDVMPVLFDCTLDIDVPVFVCYIYDVERGVGMYRGYAAHLDPIVAQCRAICEAAQGRLVYIAGSRDDFSDKSFKELKKQDNSETLVRLLANKKTVSSNYREDKSTDTFFGDIKTVVSILDKAEIPEPLIKEYSHPYPCSVVKVMVPTLEGYYTKFAKSGKRALK
jgi:ribosomal protein S12 methylthiotransferase accessory factor